MSLFVCSTLFLAVLDLVTGQGQCSWTLFPDVHSRVVVADVVFRGRLLPTSGVMDKAIWKVAVDEVFKGELKDSETAIQFVVGSGLEACPKIDMKVGQRYLLFLKSTKTDGSIYYASSPPEPLTTRNVLEAKKYGCRQCDNAGHYPKARLSAKKTFWNIGDKIKMTCQLNGLPTPRVTWYKNNLEVLTTSNVQIISRKSLSQLIIDKADDQDGGTYSCVATNVLGSAPSDQSHVIIETGMLALNDELPPHATLCEEQTLCLNGGVCHEIKELKQQFCLCPDGFSGKRCQDKGPEVGIGSMDGVLVIVCILLMLLLLVTTFAMLFCIAKFRHDVTQHFGRYLAIVEGMTERNNGRLQAPLTVQKSRRSPDLIESQALLFPDEDHPLSQPQTTPRSAKAARTDIVRAAKASSPLNATAAAAAAATAVSSASSPTRQTPSAAPARPGFDSSVVEKGAGPFWIPKASEFDLSPEWDNMRSPSPVVQKKVGALGASTRTCPKMVGSSSNCSAEEASSTYAPSEAARVGYFFDGSDRRVKEGAIKGLSSRCGGSDKKMPGQCDDDVNALLIELGVYAGGEGGKCSSKGD